ncbi:MAG: dephospho-CoA kinase [Magnetococcales bacterium]|nr:dephospho-CoA kinase [Magnetococcales bacterium]
MVLAKIYYRDVIVDAGCRRGILLEGLAVLVVGLTGSMGCGKSSVARLLAARGGQVLDSDRLAREALVAGSPGLHQVVERFGRDILNPAGEVDRASLGLALRADAAGWAALEAIVHPQVRRLQAAAMVRLYRENPAAVIVLDEPLLFETGGDALCDVTVVVACGEQQVQRLQQRGGMDFSVQQAALARQMAEVEKCRRADRVIDNSGSLLVTEEQVVLFWAWVGCLAGRGGGAWPERWRVYL